MSAGSLGTFHETAQNVNNNAFNATYVSDNTHSGTDFGVNPQRQQVRCIFSGCPECGCLDESHGMICPSYSKNGPFFHVVSNDNAGDESPDFTTEHDARAYLRAAVNYAYFSATEEVLKCIAEKDIVGFANLVKKQGVNGSFSLDSVFLSWDDLDFDFRSVEYVVGFHAPKMLVQFCKKHDLSSYEGYFDFLILSGRYDLVKVLNDEGI
eukprot:PhF_6_TR40707/c0_g1_i3/m.61205